MDFDFVVLYQEIDNERNAIHLQKMLSLLFFVKLSEHGEFDGHLDGCQLQFVTMPR